jgi:hypothetical protein
MKRFFAKIGRFFWSWGFLKFILVSVTLIILFYVEEDWRGARAWAATKAEWEAKGESFDFNKFIPPPVPDDQNLAAIPLFKLEPVKSTYNETTYMTQVALKRAMRDDLPSLDFPNMGKWQQGELPDMGKIKKTMAANYALAFKNTTPPDDSLAQFNAIYPFFTDFLSAAATHPDFRINFDYTISPPAARPFGPITDPIKLSKILTLHAILALDHHQPDLALQDIKINYELLSGVKRDPTLVGGLVAIGMNAINGAAIYNGLVQHEWNDAQLVELDQALQPINFLADFQFAMRSEVAQSTANVEFFQHANRSKMEKLFGRSYLESPVAHIFDFPWPSGWWDSNKSRMATLVFQSLAGVDPKECLVFPKEAADLQHQIEEAKASWSAYAPWNILADIAAGPITNATSKFAQAQVCIDEARIACALERYRLAHGVYPDSLDALAPACIDELPHDIMNGQPYRYQLRPDGTYLLYSVGWNQTDDGGKVVFMKDAPALIDYTQGDWVWLTPQLNPQK